MFYKLDNKELETMNKASNITCTDYEIEDGNITVGKLIATIDDLLIELGVLQERLSDLEEELEQNYRPIPLSEQYGIRNSDFY